MKKIKFGELGTDQLLTATVQILDFKNNNELPFDAAWQSTDDVLQYLNGNYENVDQHFSFYLNVFGEVTTKVKS